MIKLELLETFELGHPSNETCGFELFVINPAAFDYTKSKPAIMTIGEVASELSFDFDLQKAKELKAWLDTAINLMEEYNASL